MDKIDEYRELVKRILLPYASHRYINADVENEAVFDEKNDHYLIMQHGWKNAKRGRIHGCIIHLDIVNGKIWIQRDGTEDGIVNALEEAGVPKSDIVAGFHSPADRSLTEYAVA